MSDAELAEYLGISNCPPGLVARHIAAMPAERRAIYERMAVVEVELALWEQGLGPKPSGVIVCRPNRPRAA